MVVGSRFYNQSLAEKGGQWARSECTERSPEDDRRSESEKGRGTYVKLEWAGGSFFSVFGVSCKLNRQFVILFLSSRWTPQISHDCTTRLSHWEKATASDTNTSHPIIPHRIVLLSPVAIWTEFDSISTRMAPVDAAGMVASSGLRSTNHLLSPPQQTCFLCCYATLDQTQPASLLPTLSLCMTNVGS